MSTPLLFATCYVGARPGRRHLAAQWMLALLIALASLLAAATAQAATHTFNNKSPNLDFCSVKGKEHSCTRSPWVNWDDQVVIASGYSLKISGDVTVGYSQGLSTSSSSVLIVAGSLNLTGVNPPNLKVSGGDIAVDGIFSVGALQHTLTANIAAGAITLGTDRVTVTGNLVSQGLVSISANSRVTGDIEGTVVTTDSSVTITGAVKATSRFTLGSRGTVTKSVNAPVFEMQADYGRVTGNVDATTSVWMGSGGSITGYVKTGTLTMQAAGTTITGDVTATSKTTMGSGNTITGDLDTGELFTESSRATITGNARVNWATLEWQGKVTGTIFCKNGTSKATCDCVTNRSGWAVNSAEGPRCEGAAPKSVDHYLITHDGQANSCVPETVTVTACANAACTAPHFASAPGTVSLSHGGGLLAFGSNGVASARVSSIQAGDLTLALTAAPVKCYNSGKRSNSCTLSVVDQTAFEIDVQNHRAGEVLVPTLLAMKPANDRKTCIPAFKDKKIAVAFSCAPQKPASSRDPLRLASAAAGITDTAAQLSCNGSATKTLDVQFDADGKGSFHLAYDDVGEVRLDASHSAEGATIKGNDLFTAAPFAFGVAVKAGQDLVAGKPFTATVTALNKNGKATRGFDVDLLRDDTGITLASCVATGLEPGAISPASARDFQDGVLSFETTWSEVGHMDLKAEQPDFLNTGLKTTGASGGNCKGTGPFVPAWLQVERMPTPGKPALDARPFDYSGEEIPILVSARNEQGNITRNYEGSYSENVTIGADVSAGGPGAWSPAAPVIAASAFKKGEASLLRAYVVGKTVKPAQITVRATSATATSKGSAGEKLKTEVRLGRLRIANRSGGEKATLEIPLVAEYWTGSSWIKNADDNFSALPKSAFAFSPSRAGMTATTDLPDTAPLTLAAGGASFMLQTTGGPGWVDIAVNLDKSSKNDNACAGTHPLTAGAARPWLRPQTSSCRNAPTDPSARATFGIHTPGSRSVIHVREVFN